MRIPPLLSVLFLSVLCVGCASQEEPRDQDLDFFERISKAQEERESARRDAEIARRKGQRPKDARPGDGTLGYYDGAKTANVGPSAPIRVTWEGLAREREIAANSKYARAGTLQPPMKITLVSESHPDAVAMRRGRRDEANASSAVLRDADLLRFIQGVERRGFYRHARPTETQAATFGHARARGRVTIERNGQSMTLISMRGQGQNPRTKEIPGIYSESKQAIMMLRNRTQNLSVTSVETDSILPGFGR